MLAQLGQGRRELRIIGVADQVDVEVILPLTLSSRAGLETLHRYAMPGQGLDQRMHRARSVRHRQDERGLVLPRGCAAVIANHFATVEDALAGAHEAHASLPPALAKKIIAGSDYLNIAPKLVRVARDAPLPKVDLAMPKAPADLSKLYQTKDQYGLGASIDRLIAALGW